MLDHLSIQCVDMAASAAFYDAVLAPIGGRRIIDTSDPAGSDTDGYGTIGYGTGFPCFWISGLLIGNGFRESHIAFRAPSREAVDAFYATATARGGEGLHAPRLWPQYHAGYYGAFVRDPDGNNVEAVHHTMEQR